MIDRLSCRLLLHCSGSIQCSIRCGTIRVSKNFARKNRTESRGMRLTKNRVMSRSASMGAAKSCLAVTRSASRQGRGSAPISRAGQQKRRKDCFGGAPKPTWETKSLQCAYDTCIMIWMRTTLNIDDELLAEARKFTGEKEKTALVHLGLRALIEREAGKRLARLGATMPKLRIAPRRR